MKGNITRQQGSNRPRDRSLLVTVLRFLGNCLPGDHAKTFVYLNFVHAPRRFLRKSTNSFYRMNLIYDVLGAARKHYSGRFSIIEFGTAQGYSFAKMLFATRYLRMEENVQVHTFDSFEGLSKPSDPKDIGLVGKHWQAGGFKGSYDTLKNYCEQHNYKNHRIHKGYFEDSLTEEVVSQFQSYKPVLVWFDCDYYESTLVALERILPVLPTGCVLYFDDFGWNYGSKFTGEARVVHEVNQGKLGEEIELLLDRKLTWDSRGVYRFIRYADSGPQYEYQKHLDPQQIAREIGNGSPMP